MQASMQEFVQQVQLEMKKAHEILDERCKGAKCSKREIMISTQTPRHKHDWGCSAVNECQCQKLTALSKGPFVIVQVLSVLYQIMSSKKDWVVHHDRLKPCRDDPLPLWIRWKRRQVLGMQEPGDGKNKQTQIKLILL